MKRIIDRKVIKYTSKKMNNNVQIVGIILLILNVSELFSQNLNISVNKLIFNEFVASKQGEMFALRYVDFRIARLDTIVKRVLIYKAIGDFQKFEEIPTEIINGTDTTYVSSIDIRSVQIAPNGAIWVLSREAIWIYVNSQWKKLIIPSLDLPYTYLEVLFNSEGVAFISVSQYKPLSTGINILTFGYFTYNGSSFTKLYEESLDASNNICVPSFIPSNFCLNEKNNSIRARYYCKENPYAKFVEKSESGSTLFNESIPTSLGDSLVGTVKGMSQQNNGSNWIAMASQSIYFPHLSQYRTVKGGLWFRSENGEWKVFQDDKITFEPWRDSYRARGVEYAVAYKNKIWCTGGGLSGLLYADEVGRIFWISREHIASNHTIFPTTGIVDSVAFVKWKGIVDTTVKLPDFGKPVFDNRGNVYLNIAFGTLKIENIDKVLSVYDNDKDVFINNSESIQISPQPCSKEMFVKGLKAGDNVGLFDLLGNQVKSFVSKSEQDVVDMSDLAQGCYLMKVLRHSSTKITILVSVIH